MERAFIPPREAERYLMLQNQTNISAERYANPPGSRALDRYLPVQSAMIQILILFVAD